MTPASPTLADSMRRFDAVRTVARDLAAGLSEAAFHRAPPEGGWSVGQCLDHLVVADSRIVERLEAAIARARAEGRLAAPVDAAAPVRLSWVDRLFIAGTAPGKAGAPPRMKVSVGDPFDPGDPAARGRTRDQVLADFLAMQERLDTAARAADGLDLAGIKVSSVLADWVKVSLGGWFIAIAGHQERHLDQARRARVAVEDLGEHLLGDAIARFKELKRLGDGAMAQIDDTAFFARLDPDANAIAHLVKHVAGNLRSRWRNFLVEDGEKPDRDRDREFELDPSADTRAALMARWEEGWGILFAELGALTTADLMRRVTIRHEPHTVVQCIQRQLGHYGYHVGQIVLLARHARGEAWTTLSVPRRQSARFNAEMQARFKP